MASSESFLKPIEEFLGRGALLEAHPLSGGDINEAYQLLFADGSTLFLKRNTQFPIAFFQAEADGLKALKESNALAVPDILAVDTLNSEAFLALEYVPSSPQRDWLKLGQGLAALHQNHHQGFGWAKDNYIGSLVQKNDWREQWSDFYAECRILFQVGQAYDQGLLNRQDLKGAEGFLKEYPNLYPLEQASLLHGDLWSGNVLFAKGGKPYLIDPAVYYGHREMDLAMMHLFGGFPDEVFQAYNAHYPLERDWRARIPWHQLYPLLVHLNLFGASYRSSCQAIWRPFS